MCTNAPADLHPLLRPLFPTELAPGSTFNIKCDTRCKYSQETFLLVPLDLGRGAGDAAGDSSLLLSTPAPDLGTRSINDNYAMHMNDTKENAHTCHK